MTDADLMGGQQTAAEQAAEDAAFAAAFNETRDATAAPEPYEVAATPATPAEPAAATPATPAEPATPATPAAATPAEPGRLIAGLTEEQLQAALARSGAMQGAVDKMAGRIGQLMQQIDALRAAPPTTQAAQTALNLKLEKLSAAFPEMAEMLREDLQAMHVAPAAAAALAPAAPAGITQEQLDAMLNSRLGETQAAINDRIEMKVLSIVHPDWLEKVKSPQFALWRDNVLGKEEGQKLMSSEDSSFISGHLTDFKKWRADTAAAAPTPPPTPTPNPRANRLANAVLPTGGAGNAGAANTIVTEEDGFLAGFAEARKAAGA